MYLKTERKIKNYKIIININKIKAKIKLKIFKIKKRLYIK